MEDEHTHGRPEHATGDDTCVCECFVNVWLYLSRVVFFLVCGPTILNMSSTAPLFPREMAFTAAQKMHTYPPRTSIGETLGSLLICKDSWRADDLMN